DDLERRTDEELLTRRLPGIGLQSVEVQRAGQRHLVGVVAGEGGRQFGNDPRPQANDSLEAKLAEERCQQPAAYAPRHAEVAHELRRTSIEAAVDVHLLVDRRPVAAVLAARRVRRNL